jgi:hypothetical protein
MSAWYGIWHGGAGYSLTDPESDMEKFGSIQEAKDALSERFHSGYALRQTFDYVNRETESVFTPAVSEESCIHLFTTPGVDYPDRRVFFGPRGGVRVERC